MTDGRDRDVAITHQGIGERQVSACWFLRTIRRCDGALTEED
jgi:hypothetical protein